jgi:hypothetical protein
MKPSTNPAQMKKFLEKLKEHGGCRLVNGKIEWGPPPSVSYIAHFDIRWNPEKLRIGNMKHIFVFGSNRQGRHGKGAALHARLEHGAIYGQAEGLQGNSYAIITKELRKTHPHVTLTEIGIGIQRFLAFARNHPSWIFHLSPIGCGLAGYSPKDIAPAFQEAPENVELPQCFLEVLGR